MLCLLPRDVGESARDHKLFCAFLQPNSQYFAFKVWFEHNLHWIRSGTGSEKLGPLKDQKSSSCFQRWRSDWKALPFLLFGQHFYFKSLFTKFALQQEVARQGDKICRIPQLAVRWDLAFEEMICCNLWNIWWIVNEKWNKNPHRHPVACQ